MPACLEHDAYYGASVQWVTLALPVCTENLNPDVVGDEVRQE